MTNKERQKDLDKQKWVRGVEVDCNPSGTMYYCSSCKYSNGYTCSKTQAELEADCLCAKAYNRMVRGK